MLLTDSDSTERLFEQAKNGDRHAFERIMESYRPRLERFAWSRLSTDLRKRVDVEDVLQETALKAMSAVEKIQWQGENALFSWMCGIALNVVYAHSRKFMRLNPSIPESLIEQDGTSPSQHLRRGERLDRLKECMRSLTEDQNQVIRLVRLQGMTIRQAAEELGRTENATSQLLWRATRKLGKLFGDTASLNLPPDGQLQDGEAERESE